MNKSIELFGVMVAVATFSSSAFANYVAVDTGAAPATVAATTPLVKVSRPNQSVTKYDPPANANGETQLRIVPTTVTYVWTGAGAAPPVDIYQRAIVDVDLKTFASNARVTSTAEVQSSVGINRSIDSGNEKITFTTGEAWFGRGYPAPPYTQEYEMTTNVGVKAKASVDTSFAPTGSSGTSQSSISVGMSEARFYYGQPAGTAATAPEPGVVGRGGP